MSLFYLAPTSHLHAEYIDEVAVGRELCSKGCAVRSVPSMNESIHNRRYDFARLVGQRVYSFLAMLRRILAAQKPSVFGNDSSYRIGSAIKEPTLASSTR